MFVARALYRKNVRSHRLTLLAKELGIRISSKTILQNLRDCDVPISGKRKKGKSRGIYRQWVNCRRTKNDTGYFENGIKKDYGRIAESTQLLYYLRKNQTLSAPLRTVANLFREWFSYSLICGKFDIEALLNGEKPP